jgi:hypothetical protein
MSAPPSFQPAASLAPWQSPAPQWLSIVQSTLPRSDGRGALRVGPTADGTHDTHGTHAGAGRGDVPAAGPLMLMHQPVLTARRASAARTDCSSASASALADERPRPVSMETGARCAAEPSGADHAERGTSPTHPVRVLVRALLRQQRARRPFGPLVCTARLCVVSRASRVA